MGGVSALLDPCVWDSFAVSAQQTGIRAQVTLGTWCLIWSSCNLEELLFGLGSQDLELDACGQGGAIGIRIMRQLKMARITQRWRLLEKCGLD